MENDKIANWCDRKRAVVLAILRQPGTNTVQVIEDIKQILPSLRLQLPASVDLSILYDRSISIKNSIHDVQMTLLITAALVVAVIFLFLRSLPATIIPSLALPMSVIGTFAVISVLGFSINVMTLMALTLCVGFVVDDAIVMLENIVRHLDSGEPAMVASLKGSREISFTILSMTLSLVAVFIPILFFGGIVGRLFKEFAVTIVVSVLISGFVSLTLTPMLCSRYLKKHGHEKPHSFLAFFEHLQEWALKVYDYWISLVIKHKLTTLLASFGVFILTIVLFFFVQKGFIPNEDIGQIFAMTEGGEDVSFEAMVRHQNKLADIVSKNPNVSTFMSAVGGGGTASTLNAGRMFICLTPRPPRQLSADEMMQELKKKFDPIPGIKVYMQNPMSIKIGGQNTKGIYQYTIQSTSLPELYRSTFALRDKLKEYPKLQDLNTDLQISSPQASVTINREKASSLGITAKQVDDALSFAYGATQISTIYTPDNEYKVILEVEPEYYRSPNLLPLLYLRSSSGKLIPLTAIAKIERSVAPLQINHLGQMASATISFNLKPGVSIGDVLPAVQKIADETLPPSVTSSFQGTAQAFQSSQQNSLWLLVIAIAVIYIVLGILYESFIHPLTILAGLPSAGFGALVTLLLFHCELNIYGWLGLVMLLGIVKKNAIMMVDSALDFQRLHNQPPEEAVYHAALVRFRPIMMTTMAALMGSLPIAVGLGSGGEARQPLGLAVVGGLIASQLLTLLITPVVYIYLDKFAHRGKIRKAKRLPSAIEVVN